MHDTRRFGLQQSAKPAQPALIERRSLKVGREPITATRWVSGRIGSSAAPSPNSTVPA